MESTIEKLETVLPSHYDKVIRYRSKRNAVCSLLRYQKWINELEPEESLLRIGYDFACFKDKLERFSMGKTLDNGLLFSYILIISKLNEFKEELSETNKELFRFGEEWYQGHNNMVKFFNDNRVQEYIDKRLKSPFTYSKEQNIEDRTGVEVFSDLEIENILIELSETPLE